MHLCGDVEGVRDIVRRLRGPDAKVGLVPTMGALHRGHVSLIERARALSDVVVVSIFLNPTQFGADEDLQSYPMDLEGDLAICRAEGVDVVWTPTAEAMYPSGFCTSVEVAGPSEGLCGAGRPGHFRGVTTVVSKLFHAVEPDLACFGQKDYQQLAVIRAMVRDLNWPIEIVPCPIVRDPDGLALSSRNVRLDPEQRRAATCLRRALGAAEARWQEGQRRPAELEAAVMAVLATESTVEPEYVEARDARTLQPVADGAANVVVALACHVGGTRLIDNVVLGG